MQPEIGWYWFSEASESHPQSDNINHKYLPSRLPLQGDYRGFSEFLPRFHYPVLLVRMSYCSHLVNQKAIAIEQNHPKPSQLEEPQNMKKNSPKILSSLLALSSAFLAASPVIAQTEIEFGEDAINRTIQQDGIQITVNYEPIEIGTGSDRKNLQYTISYQGKERVAEKKFTFYTGSAFLQDLDNNGISEAIVKTFSGGAHCCTIFSIYSWDGNQFVETAVGGDGAGGSFMDIDNDGTTEFVTMDNAFLYQFSSYAGSFPPTKILKFASGDWVDVTRQYPQYLESVAASMYQTFVSNKNSGEVNGILAGYVAQKILLGEYREGWDFMLANYDRTSDWGLEIYEGNTQVGTYSDFPTALRMFLIEQGYLQPNDSL
jgi:hypothetical protein